MTSSYKRSVEFKNKTPARFDTFPEFDRFRNLQFAVLRQALQDALGDSPYYKRESLIWLNSSDALDCFLELGITDSIRDFLESHHLIIPILAIDTLENKKIIPIFIRPEDLSQ